MLFSEDGIKYKIVRQPSVYTVRRGKEDCRIWLSDGNTRMGGERHSDGFLYRTSMVIACETGEVIRDWGESIPSCISDEWLKQNNFIDKGAKYLELSIVL